MFRTAKVIPSGGSLRITLPAEWTKKNKITAGQELQLLDNTLLIVIPTEISSTTDIDKILSDIKGALNFRKK